MNLPVVGLASSETAQVNIVSLATSQSSQWFTSSGSPTAASCTGTIAFYNAGGGVMGNPKPFTVTSGQIFATTLPYSDVTGATAPRTTIRAVVTANGCTLSTNIETFDTATGVTHIHAEGPSTGIFPNLRLLGAPTR